MPSIRVAGDHRTCGNLNEKGEARAEQGMSKLFRVNPSTFFLGIALIWGVCGCTSAGKPVVWKNNNTQFDNYRALEILPVINATGTTLDQTIEPFLSGRLRDQIDAANLPVEVAPASPEGILVVQSELLVFDAYEYRRLNLEPSTPNKRTNDLRGRNDPVYAPDAVG